MVKLLCLAAAAVGAVVLVPVIVIAAALGPGVAGSGGSPAGPVATGREAAVPVAWVDLYRSAATAECRGLDWSVLAAVGTVESGNGRSRAAGVWSGANPAGAEGPMQFEPSTFAAYATVGPDGARPPSPYDPVDAVFTAARLLCTDGAASATGLRSALLDYNHSSTYADTVAVLAVALHVDTRLSEAAASALEFAAGHLGVPYRWGGEGPGGFDCSGLVQAAYASGGVALPRVAQAQFDAGPAVAGGSPVLPGDLVFYGSGPSGVDHVGLYVGDGEMIDAPHTGAVVRVEDAGWTSFVGASQPA